MCFEEEVINISRIGIKLFTIPSHNLAFHPVSKWLLKVPEIEVNVRTLLN